MKTIPLTQGKVALVDDELFDELNQFKWYAKCDRKTFYAVRSIKLDDGRQTKRYMHHDIFRLLGEEISGTVDHKDRNGLNNQFDNLRPATPAGQSCNRGKRIDNKSGYAGVSWNKWNGKWKAEIRINNTRKHLGYFDDPAVAAKVRDEYALKHGGEFVVLNSTLSAWIPSIR